MLSCIYEKSEKIPRYMHWVVVFLAYYCLEKMHWVAHMKLEKLPGWVVVVLATFFARWDVLTCKIDFARSSRMQIADRPTTSSMLQHFPMRCLRPRPPLGWGAAHLCTHHLLASVARLRLVRLVILRGRAPAPLPPAPPPSPPLPHRVARLRRPSPGRGPHRVARGVAHLHPLGHRTRPGGSLGVDHMAMDPARR